MSQLELHPDEVLNYAKLRHANLKVRSGVARGAAMLGRGEPADVGRVAASWPATTTPASWSATPARRSP